jgi:hypothetical protein
MHPVTIKIGVGSAFFMYMLALRGMYAEFGSPMHRCPIRAASPPNQLCHPTRSSYGSRKELLPWPGYSLCLRRSRGNSEPGSATVPTACSVRSFCFDTQIADQYLAAPNCSSRCTQGEDADNTAGSPPCDPMTVSSVRDSPLANHTRCVSSAW